MADERGNYVLCRLKQKSFPVYESRDSPRLVLAAVRFSPCSLAHTAAQYVNDSIQPHTAPHIKLWTVWAGNCVCWDNLNITATKKNEKLFRSRHWRARGCASRLPPWNVAHHGGGSISDNRCKLELVRHITAERRASTITFWALSISINISNFALLQINLCAGRENFQKHGIFSSQFNYWLSWSCVEQKSELNHVESDQKLLFLCFCFFARKSIREKQFSTLKSIKSQSNVYRLISLSLWKVC